MAWSSELWLARQVSRDLTFYDHQARFPGAPQTNKASPQSPSTAPDNPACSALALMSTVYGGPDPSYWFSPPASFLIAPSEWVSYLFDLSSLPPYSFLFVFPLGCGF